MPSLWRIYGTAGRARGECKAGFEMRGGVCHPECIHGQRGRRTINTACTRIITHAGLNTFHACPSPLSPPICPHLSRYDIMYKQDVGTEDVFLGLGDKSPGSSDCTHMTVRGPVRRGGIPHVSARCFCRTPCSCRRAGYTAPLPRPSHWFPPPPSAPVAYLCACACTGARRPHDPWRDFSTIQRRAQRRGRSRCTSQGTR